MTAPTMPEVYAQEGWGAHEVEPAVSGWGDAIPVDGVRPSWLPDDVRIRWVDIDGQEGINDSYPVSCIAEWSHITAIRLPVPRYDFVYIALERGYTPWFGGDEAPGDWDASKPVLFGNGMMFVNHDWDWRSALSLDNRIIGYHATSTALPLAHPAADVCASCGFPWGAEPVRHSEFCDNRTLAHPAAPQGEEGQLAKHVKALADSLEAELRDRYGVLLKEPMHRDTHRRFERDMQEVYAARSALAALAPAAIASGRGEGE
jgi:hypothetical protein